MLFTSFFNDTAPTEIYTLSLHDALPICGAVYIAGRVLYGMGYRSKGARGRVVGALTLDVALLGALGGAVVGAFKDRKSTRLNSSHPSISYAVFCLKKKRKNYKTPAFTRT